MAFDGPASGYRQPAQARVFGTGALIVTGLLGTLLLSIRLIAPPVPAIDAGQRTAFVVEAIPLDQPLPDRTELSPPTPPHPAPEPSPPTPAPPSKAIAAAVPAIATPSSVAMSSAVSPAQPAAERALPPSLPSGSRLAEGPVAATPPAVSASAAADWRARLLGHLKRYRRYPRQAEAARQQGVARVAITLRRSGEVTAVELVHGSGYPLLDMEARTTVRRASPLPAVDDAVAGDPVTVEVPIDFALRR